MTEQKHEGHELSNRSDKSAIYMPIAVVIAALLIAVGLFFGLTSSKSTTAPATGAQAAAQPAVNIKDVKTSGEPFIGNANAPIVMAFWSDYQCPFCKAFEVGGVPQIPMAAVMPTLIKDYVDTGKLKIVFKDYPFLGPDSTTDAEYARAVWSLYPNQYYAWRSAIITAQPQENSLSAAENSAHLQKITASVAGIDIAKVEADVAKNKAAYDAVIQADTQEGSSFGVSGTPAFIVGKTLISGAQPLSAFTTALNAAK